MTPDLPSLPRNDQGSPVFREPWEAQAVAMAVRLYEVGHFTWGEWASALADQIQQAQAAGDPDRLARRPIRRRRRQSCARR